MKVLLDADTVAFTAAIVNEENPVEAAIEKADASINYLLADLEASSHELFLTGKTNFRYDIYPEYKATRKGSTRPKWEEAVKQFFIEEWGAVREEGCEADDLVSIRRHELPKDSNTIVAHIDKDLDMIPGWHYNWELQRLGVVIRPAKKYFVSDYDAMYNFYYQLLIGDRTDNVRGAIGVGPVNAAKILEGRSVDQMLEACREAYNSDEELVMNAQVLWLWRTRGDIWNGLPLEGNPSLSLSSETEAVDGPPNSIA